MAKTVVIIGAGWAGLPLAHKLLKYTLPKLEGGLKVVLVSPNSSFYWNVAAVRGVIPNAIPDEKLFLPIQPGFAGYSQNNFEFVLGKAVRIDLAVSMVEVAENQGARRFLLYDQLVIATGSRIRSNLPFKPIGTHEETLSAFHELQRQIGAAKSIVIAGAGPTGVETAGEIAAACGDKKQVTLVVSGDHVLQASNTLSSVCQTVEKDLRKLGVKLVYNAQVKDTQVDENGKGKGTGSGSTMITLSNGSKLVADLYLPLFGVEVNTSFVPPTLLDTRGNVILHETMRVKNTNNIWAIGDVGDVEDKQVTVIDAQIIHLSTNLDSVLTGQNTPIKEYKPATKRMIFIVMGKKYATGAIGSWRLWGWLVAYVKGRAIFVDTAPGYVGGKHLRHSSM